MRYFYENGSTVPELAALYAISDACVIHNLRRTGNGPPTQPVGRPVKVKEPKQPRTANPHIAAVRELMAEKLIDAEIARRLNVSREYVRQVRNKHQLGRVFKMPAGLRQRIEKGRKAALRSFEELRYRACSRCGEMKSPECFSRGGGNSGKSQKRPDCKACVSQLYGERGYTLKWRLANPEKAKLVQARATARYHERHPDAVKRNVERSRLRREVKWRAAANLANREQV